MMMVEWGKFDEHATALRLGLSRMVPGFHATICWWCDGTTVHKFECCDVCGKGRQYGTALGLLINNKPAPESVVNQVLEAAKKCL